MAEARYQPTEGEVACADVLALIIGVLGISDENNSERHKAIDDALIHLRDSYLEKHMSVAAAMIEYIRENATEPSSNPSMTNLLRRDSAGSS
jgi:hypothetical protein